MNCHWKIRNLNDPKIYTNEVIYLIFIKQNYISNSFSLIYDLDIDRFVTGLVKSILLNEFSVLMLNISLPLESYQYSVLESLPVSSVVAKLKAADADIGSNAEMDYRIIDGDAPGVFNVTTDEETQEGIIFLQRVRS